MTLGLDNLVVATVSEKDGVETYSAPEKMAEAMTAELSVTNAEGTLYADDAVSETVKEFIKGSIKLGIKELSPEMLAKLLGQTVDQDQVIYGGGSDEEPYVAIGFRARKASGKFRYIWLYKVKFKVPNEKYQTQGESITFNTPTIEGEFYKRSSDNLWKADYVGTEDDSVAATFLDSVRQPNNATA